MSRSGVVSTSLASRVTRHAGYDGRGRCPRHPAAGEDSVGSMAARSGPWVFGIPESVRLEATSPESGLMKPEEPTMDVPIDLLTENHELLGFDLEQADWWQWLEVDHGGKRYRVRVPLAYDNGVERVVRVDDGGDLLYLIGEVGYDLDDRGRIGCLIVARPAGDGTYRAVVFHSLYPLARTGLI